MEPEREAESPPSAEESPLPVQVDTPGSAATSGPPSVPSSPESPPASFSPSTTTAVLASIAASEGSWFASRYAAETGVPRDSLDEPLAELRLAGLIRVAEWVKGLGQGYVLTPEGEAAAADPSVLERLKHAPPVVTPPATRPEPAGEADESTPEEPPAETGLVIKPPMVVPALLMANALWFFVCAVVIIRAGGTLSQSLTGGDSKVLHRFGAVTGADLLNGEWWRLLTSCFVHFGAIHLIGNLLALAMMGPLAELLWGRLRLLAIYFISGLAGSCLAMALHPDSLLAGASGAVWGVLMSLFAWLFAFRRHLPPDLASDWFRRLCVVFLLNAAVSFLPGVSWEGHLGGGVAGFLAAGLLNAARFGDQRRRISAWILLALLPVLSVAGLAAAMDAKGMPGWQRLRQRIALEQDVRTLNEKVKKFQAAKTEFDKEVLPLLSKLSPDVVKPLELEAAVLTMRTKRSPERVTATRTKIESLKSVADTIVQLTTREPSGSEQLDRLRDQARAFAAARAKSFDLLLTMLATEGTPKAETWQAWQAARHEADRLWTELATRKP